MRPEAFFLAAKSDQAEGQDQRLMLFYRAATPKPLGRVVYVHPFAEEMNKSRRMAALQARALASAGFSVVQIDLRGCGDSSGDYALAGWKDWIADVLLASDWLRALDSTHAAAPLWLWGLRAGCLVAAAAAEQLSEPCNFCFWQPQLSGKTVLQQFLRLRLAAELAGSGGKGLMDAMRQKLARGECVEVAGYVLAPDLAHGLEAASLRPPSNPGGRRLEWLELSTREDGRPSPASAQTLATFEAAGMACASQIVSGPSFWQTTEIEDAPQLIAATVAALRRVEFAA